MIIWAQTVECKLSSLSRRHVVRNLDHKLPYRSNIVRNKLDKVMLRQKPNSCSMFSESITVIVFLGSCTSQNVSLCWWSWLQKCIFEPTKLKFYFKLHFSAAKKVRETRVSQQHKGKSNRPEDSATHGRLPIKMFPKVTWSLLRNAPFVFVMITGGTEGILTSGFATFAPKYIQNKFHVSSGTAALLTGKYGH